VAANAEAQKAQRSLSEAQSDRPRRRRAPRSNWACTPIPPTIDVLDAGQRATEGELTIRAIMAGVVIGLPLLASNVYLSLKTGWSDSNNALATLLGFSLFRVLLGRTRHGYSVRENNITQTVASAMCMAPIVAGVDSSIAAYVLLGGGPRHLAMAVFGLGIAVAAIAFAALFRRTFLDASKLVFPTGVVTSDLLLGLHGGTLDARGRLRRLAFGGVLGAGVPAVRASAPRWVPAVLTVPWSRMAGTPGTLGVGMSPAMVGIGMLVGTRIGLSWFAGSFVAWAGIVPELPRANELSFPDALGVLAWPAAGLLAGSTVTDLVRRAAHRLRPNGRDGRTRLGPIGEPRDSSGVRRLLVAAGALGVVTVWLSGSFGLALPWNGLLVALAITPLVTIVSARSAGETDTVLSSTAQQLTQVTVTTAAHLGALERVMLGGIATGAGLEASSLYWSLRAGQRIGANPLRQTLAHLLGTVLGAPIGVALFHGLTARVSLGSPQWPASGGQFTRATSLALSTGLGGAPPFVLRLAIAGALLGAVLGPAGALRWAPASAALAIGLMTPLPLSTAVLVGAVIAALWTRIGAPASAAPADTSASAPEPPHADVAAGLVVGESITGLVLALVEAA
jgi:uncharacterized oligopeptide transporter (OPT) family protein